MVRSNYSRLREREDPRLIFHTSVQKAQPIPLSVSMGNVSLNASQAHSPWEMSAQIVQPMLLLVTLLLKQLHGKPAMIYSDTMLFIQHIRSFFF